METGRGVDGAGRGVTSRRSLLKGLTSLIAVGAVAQLATAGPSVAAAQPIAVASAGMVPSVEVKPAAAGARQAAEPKQGGTLKWATFGAPPALDPSYTAATATVHIGWHVYEGLFTRDANNGPKMDLLEKYEHSADGKKVTMTLRKDVLFHNDKELTSADVEASLARFATMHASGRLVFDALTSMTVPDKYTVVLELKEPRAGILPVALSRIAAIVAPAEAVQQAGRGPIATPIGTGPYKLVEHLPDKLTRVQRFDRYVAREDPSDGPAGKKVAHIDEIQFLSVPDPAARLDGVATGEYHFADSLELSQYAQVNGLPDIEVDIGKPYLWAVAHLNKQDGLFTNVKLRQAVLAAISVDPIAAAAFGVPELYRVAPGLAAHETPWYVDEGQELFNAPNPDRAKALLEEAGYDGTPIRWLSTEEYFYNHRAGLVFKQQLEAVGFKVDLQLMDWATVVRRRGDPKEYDVFVTAHEANVHPVLQPFLLDLWPGWWTLPAKNEVAAKLLAESDEAKQVEYVRELQRLFYDDVPGVKYGEYFVLRARSKTVMGAQNGPDPYFWNAWLA